MERQELVEQLRSQSEELRRTRASGDFISTLTQAADALEEQGRVRKAADEAQPHLRRIGEGRDFSKADCEAHADRLAAALNPPAQGEEPRCGRCGGTKVSSLPDADGICPYCRTDRGGPDCNGTGKKPSHDGEGGGKPTHYFDKASREFFPCRCGETHTGDYAAYDYGHHNCFHKAPLSPLPDSGGDLMCPECGNVFNAANRSTLDGAGEGGGGPKNSQGERSDQSSTPHGGDEGLREAVAQWHEYGTVESEAERAYAEAGDHPRAMAAAIEAAINEGLRQFDAPSDTGRQS